MIVRVLAAAFAVALPAAAVADETCGPWATVQASTAIATLTGIAAGDDRLVAVGRNGLAATSGDGWSWRLRPTGTSFELEDVIFHDGLFVAVGGEGRSGYPAHVVGPPAILVSPDGIVWREASQTHGVADAGALHAVAWGDGRFVAVGDDGVVMSSPNGETWDGATVAPLPPGSTGADLQDVVWAGDRWVAVGSRPLEGWITTSADGVTWSTALELFDVGFSAVAAGGGRVIAIDRQGGGVASRPDGSWEAFENQGLSQAGDLVWNGSRFVAVGWYSDPDAPPIVVVGTSSDGATWSWNADFAAGLPDAMAGLNGQLVVVGAGSTLGLSRDGLSWEWRTRGSAERMVAAAEGSGGLLAFEQGVRLWPGGWGPYENWARFADSADGLSFDWTDLGLYSFAGGVARHGATDVAVGYPKVLVRQAGGPWTAVESAAADHRNLYAVAWGDPGFVAVGPRSTLIHSPDGREWTRADLVVDSGFDDVVWTGERYVAVGAPIRYLYDTAVAVSTDGVAWELIPEAFEDRLLALTFTGDHVVGVGLDGAIATSPDGLTWTPQQSGTEQYLGDVVWTGRELLAVGGGGTVLTSPDGHTWQSESTGHGSFLDRAAALGDREIVSGTGLIQVRDCPPDLAAATERLLIPAVADLPGLLGSRWRSHTLLHNPNPQAVMAWVSLLPWEGVVVSAGPVPVVVPPGETLDLDGELARLLGLEPGAGALEVASDAPLVAVSRTFARDGAGTSGQGVPALPLDRVVVGSDPVVLPLLAGGSRFRTNLGLVNLAEDPLEVAVEVRSDQGTTLSARTLAVPPHRSLQINDLLGGSAGADHAWATVAALTSGARYAAYASVVDNATADPTLVLATPVSDVPLVVPAAAHSDGLHGTRWRSDLQVVNPGTLPARVRLELLAEGQDNTEPAAVERTLAGGSALTVEDALASLFGASGRAALRVVPLDGSVAASSRTFTVGDVGTLGQGVPAVEVGNLAGLGGPQRLVGLHWSPDPDEGFRTNLGLLNLDPDPLLLHVDLIRSDGTLLGGFDQLLPPFGFLQRDGVLGPFVELAVADGHAVITSPDPGAVFLVYASVVDNRSRDPVFQLGVVARCP